MNANEFNHVGLVYLARARWRLLLVLVSTVLAICALGAFFATPIYLASTTLIASSDSNSVTAGLWLTLGDSGGIASLVGVNLGNSPPTIEVEPLLQSRQFTETFISDNNLLPILIPNRWDASREKCIATWIHPVPPTLYDGSKKFDDGLQ